MFEKYTNFIGENTNVKVYLLKKQGRKHFEAFILPNGIDDEVRQTYKNNLISFLNGKTIAEYDFLFKRENAVVVIQGDNLEIKNTFIECIQTATAEAKILNINTFGDDYSTIVIELQNNINNQIEKMYLFAKYMKVETWYKKGVKYGFTANNLIEKKTDILVLNGCIDAILLENEILVLQERNFESIFNYYETAKQLVENNQINISSWSFLSDTPSFINKVMEGKTRTMALANALKNSKTNWASISIQNVKSVLESNAIFSEIAFDNNNKIICTDKNADLIISIIREVYSKQLFTNEIIETKGV